MRTVDLMFPALAVGLLFTVVEGVSCNKETAMSKAAVESNNRLTNGVWGGEHIRLEVTDRGATIEYDCAHSTIDEPVFLDSEGNFDVKGKYSPEHGGPISRDEESNSQSVRYVGNAKGKQLTLTITIPDRKETIGNFTLTLGSDGMVMKCR